MRVVAVGAIFGNRRMLLDERTTFFSVAGIAGLGKAVAFGQFGPCGAVHVVAIRARHLAFRDRVVRWLVDLRTLLLVALVADFGLRGFADDLVLVGVGLVARITGHVRHVVLGAGPQRALGVLVVAVLADLVSALGSNRAVLAKSLAKSDIGLG